MYLRIYQVTEMRACSRIFKYVYVYICIYVYIYIYIHIYVPVYVSGHKKTCECAHGFKLTNSLGLQFNGKSFDDNNYGAGSYQARNVGTYL